MNDILPILLSILAALVVLGGLIPVLMKTRKNITRYPGTRDANDPVAAQFAAWTNLFNGEWSASLFLSQDPVAIDSVGLDFLRSEFGDRLTRMSGHDRHADNYLHEAARADDPPSGTVYQPDGARLASLGVHEHWNNARDKQYSRNLNAAASGIELLQVQPR